MTTKTLLIIYMKLYCFNSVCAFADGCLWSQDYRVSSLVHKHWLPWKPIFLLKDLSLFEGWETMRCSFVGNPDNFNCQTVNQKDSLEIACVYLLQMFASITPLWTFLFISFTHSFSHLTEFIFFNAMIPLMYHSL